MIDAFHDYLRKEGLRVTGQRDLIARTFFRHKGHLSAEELHREVRKRDEGIGFATVYRTLKVLRKSGLASGIQIGDGRTRYEPEAGAGHHDHLICRGCGKIVEFENTRIEKLQKTVAEEHGFVITEHKLELYGFCSRCRRGLA